MQNNYKRTKLEKHIRSIQVRSKWIFLCIISSLVHSGAVSILDDLTDPADSWMEEEEIHSIPSVEELMQRVASMREVRTQVVNMHHQLSREHARIIGEDMRNNFAVS
jgi:hypothetical protein